MSHTITAIFENGVIRPLENVELSNGEEVEVILLQKTKSDAKKSRHILTEIAELPLEGKTNGFSGQDHDEILYPKNNP